MTMKSVFDFQFSVGHERTPEQNKNNNKKNYTPHSLHTAPDFESDVKYSLLLLSVSFFG